MKLSRSQITSGIQPLKMSLPISEILFEEITFSSDTIEIVLYIDKTHNEFLFRGNAFVCLREYCDRCLVELVNPVEAKINFLLTENESLLKESDSDICLFPIHETHFDLNPIIHDAILLARSMKILCKDDCLGLCSQCGANLNEKKCTCEKSHLDERWAPLKHIHLL